MAYSYTITENINLLIVKFRGTIPYSEEADAVVTVLDDSRIRPNVKILVDRVDSSFGSQTEDVSTHIERVAGKLASLGKPRVAVVVTSDLDFGMLRMFEAMSEGQIDHEFRVFRTLQEGCDWLSVDPDTVDWPE